MGLGCVTNVQDVFLIVSRLALPLPQRFSDRFAIVS